MPPARLQAPEIPGITILVVFFIRLGTWRSVLHTARLINKRWVNECISFQRSPLFQDSKHNGSWPSPWRGELVSHLKTCASRNSGGGLLTPFKSPLLEAVTQHRQHLRSVRATAHPASFKEPYTYLFDPVNHCPLDLPISLIGKQGRQLVQSHQDTHLLSGSAQFQATGPHNLRSHHLSRKVNTEAPFATRLPEWQN